MLHFQELIPYDSVYRLGFLRISWPSWLEDDLKPKQGSSIWYIAGNTILFCSILLFSHISAFCSWFWLSLFILSCTFSYGFAESNGDCYMCWCWEINVESWTKNSDFVQTGWCTEDDSLFLSLHSAFHLVLQIIFDLGRAIINFIVDLSFLPVIWTCLLWKRFHSTQLRSFQSMLYFFH